MFPLRQLASLSFSTSIKSQPSTHLNHLELLPTNIIMELVVTLAKAQFKLSLSSSSTISAPVPLTTSTGVIHSTASTPKKVILVGHSYGSVLTNALLSTNPDIVDSAILTGWAYAFSAPLILAAAQPRIENQLHP